MRHCPPPCGWVSHQPFSAPGRSVLTVAMELTTLRCERLPVPGSARWRGSWKRHPQQSAGLLCLYGERVPLGAVGPECSSPSLEPRTSAERGSLSVPLYLRQSLGHTHAHMYTRAHTHTHPSGSVRSWQRVLCVPGLGSHVSGITDQKGCCDVAAGPEPLGGFLCTWPGLCGGCNPCEPLQHPEPGPPSHLRDRG